MNGLPPIKLTKVPDMREPNQCTIPVDWAYAFDYLSILEVKRAMIGGQCAVIQAFVAHLTDQLNPKVFKTIHNSPEYHALFAANVGAWNGVQKARYGQITAKEVDDLNMARQAAKQVLQKRFWHNDLTEIKS